jgi:hypothetical protein
MRADGRSLVDPAGSRNALRRRSIARGAAAARHICPRRWRGRESPAAAIDAGRTPAVPTQAPDPGARSSCTDARSLAAARRHGLGQEESRCGLGGNDTRGARVTVDAAIGGIGWCPDFEVRKHSPRALSELRNRKDTSNSMILVPLLNPKFANVPAEKSCELRVRGTRADPVPAESRRAPDSCMSSSANRRPSIRAATKP